MTLDFHFTVRNRPQTVPTGHPGTPHEPKLERHRASAGLREAFYRERPGGNDAPEYPLGHPAPWPLASGDYILLYILLLLYKLL